MTPNNYNYKKKVDKVDDFITSFLQNNIRLPKSSQQKLMPNNNKNINEEDTEQDIPELHEKQDYDSDSDDEDAFEISQILQEPIDTGTTRVETEMKRDKQHKISQQSNKDNITGNSDSSFPSNHSTPYISTHSKTHINKEKHRNIQHAPLNSETSGKHTTIPKPAKTKMQDNIYITNNLTYGDELQTATGSRTRILGHNVNGIESYNFATLELVCDSMRKFNIDVAGLSETNLHFNHPQVKNSMQKVIRKFWSRKKLITSETDLT